MLELRIVAGMHQVPPASLIDILGPVQARVQLGEMVDAMIALLDTIDGDTDVELNGDEADGSMGEDDFCDHSDVHRYPGCPISDPDCCVTDAPHDKAEEGDWEADRTWSLPHPVYGEDQSSPQRRQRTT